MGIEQALNEWRQVVGIESVFDGAGATRRYGADASAIARRIGGAVAPQTAEVIPEIIRIAARNKVSVYPISTGRNWGYGTSLPVRDGSVILDLSQMSRILNFDPELGTVTLEPGVTQQQLAEFLDQGGHPFLVPVTGAGPTCSLIGNALERGYGVTPFVDHFGAVTDLEAVLADGTVFRTALREAAGEDLARLFKWGIGPYSAGLFTQSGFGVVTRMTIVLARRPECVKVCLFSLKDDRLLEEAVERIRRVLASLPGTVGAINLMNQRRVLAMSAPFPEDKIGPDGLIPETVIASMGRQYQIFPWTGFGTLYGTSRVVKAAQRDIRSILSGVASRLMFLSPAQAKSLASLTRILPGATGQRLSGTVSTLAKSLELVAGRPNETALPLCYWRNPNPPQGPLMDPAKDGCGLKWYAPLVPMRPKTVRDYVHMVERVATKHGIEPLITFTSISDKIFDSTVPLIFERNKPEAADATNACYKALLMEGKALGCFPYRIGIDTMETLSGLQESARHFHVRLRDAVDPDRLIAPGRYE